VGTLSDDELARIRRELLDNVLDVGALPFADFRHVYGIIRDNVSSSTTAAATTATGTIAANAGSTTITVASATGLAVGTRVQVDVDSQREVCTIKSLASTTVGLVLAKAHAGTYPVEIESALTLVRGTLSDLAAVQDELNVARKTGGIKKVDEVEFFGREGGGMSRLQELRAEQSRLRLDLARMCGLGRWLRNAEGSGGAGGFEAY
jgi:hypothetical protein